MKVLVVSDMDGVSGVKWEQTTGGDPMYEEGRPAAAVAPYDPGAPCEIRIEFTSTNALDEYPRKPGVEVAGSRELVSRADDWWSAWRQFFC